MSRFFKKKDDSSSSEDSSEEDSKQIKEQQPEVKEQPKPEPKALPAKQKGKQQLYGDDSSESEEEERVVKTTTEKRTENLEKIFKATLAHTKNNDFNSMLTDFEQIQEEMDKCVGSVIATDKLQTLPAWVLKNLLDINDCINDITPEQKKKMNKNNAQAFTKLRQKFKKYLETGGDHENTFQAQLDEYKKNPQEDESSKKKKKESDSDDDSNEDGSDDDEEDSDDNDDSDDSEKQVKKKAETKKEDKKKEDKNDKEESSSQDSSSDEDSDEKDKTKPTLDEKKKKKDESESDDSSSSGSDSNDSDSDAAKKDDEKDDKDDEESEESDNVDQDELPKHLQFLKLQHKDKQPHERRWKWVKYDRLPEDMRKFIKPPGGKGDDDGKKHKHRTVAKGPGHEVDPDQEKQVVKDWELDFKLKENVDRVINDYTVQQNSRKNFVAGDQIKTLNVMEEALKDNADNMIDILMLLIKANLNYSKNMPNGFLLRDVWITICQKTSQFIEAIETQKKLKSQKDAGQTADEVDDFDKYDAQMKDQLVLLTFVDTIEKLDKQLFQAFQSLDQSHIEYLFRLKDECMLLKLVDKMMKFFETIDDQEKVARISLIKLEHIYYKNDRIYEQTKELLKGKPQKMQEIYFMEQPSRQVVQDLVNKISQNCSKKEKIRALLLQIYHHAIHNRVKEGRDLMMRGQFSQIIHKQPKINRIHYNRAIVQIGLSLFRLGRFVESNTLLMEIYQTSRLRESLAQSTKQFDDDTEERKLQRPAHLHINWETVECVYMTTSMFLEIPNISTNKFTIQKNVISKNFRKLIDQYDQKGIQFLPQTSRDYVVFAARELHRSQWEAAFAHLSKIQVFQRMNEFKDGELKAALLKQVQETCLQVYIIENQMSLESIKLDQTDAFKMSKNETLKLVSKIIHKGSVKAQICSETDTLLFQGRGDMKMDQWKIGMLPQNNRSEVDFLQKKHLEQIKTMVDANDRFMDLFVNQSYHQFQPTYTHTHTYNNDRGDRGNRGGR